MRILETADLEMDEHYLPKMVKTMSELLMANTSFFVRQTRLVEGKLVLLKAA